MKSKININGTTYEVYMKDGVRYVNGMTVDEFLLTLEVEDLVYLANIGAKIWTGF